MELSGKQRKPSVYGGWLGFAGPTNYSHQKEELPTQYYQALEAKINWNLTPIINYPIGIQLQFLFAFN